jgi:hypothetical protein
MNSSNKVIALILVFVVSGCTMNKSAIRSRQFIDENWAVASANECVFIGRLYWFKGFYYLGLRDGEVRLEFDHIAFGERDTRLEGLKGKTVSMAGTITYEDLQPMRDDPPGEGRSSTGDRDLRQGNFSGLRTLVLKHARAEKEK